MSSYELPTFNIDNYIIHKKAIEQLVHWLNTYNQPGVEIGKRITKMKLKEVFGKSVVTIG